MAKDKERMFAHLNGMCCCRARGAFKYKYARACEECWVGGGGGWGRGVSEMRRQGHEAMRQLKKKTNKKA